jgi:hypothetical protein
VRDQADQTPAALQIGERAHRQVERFGVERAEALVDEDRAEADAALVCLGLEVDELRQRVRLIVG